MFFSSDMLSKRGPLARVWLAAHVERRLSKNQLLSTSIPQSVTAILDPSTTTEIPLALRLSGQLLLGVTRIYGRKAKYLLDDCNEALLKIKMAFRTGGGAAAVDMSEEQEAAGREGINMKERAGVLDFEIMYGGAAYDAAWDLDGGYQARSTRVGGNSRIDADIGDITLPEHEGMAMGGTDAGYDLDLGGLGGIDSQDFDMNLDLGLELEGVEDPGVPAVAGRKRHRSMSLPGEGDDTFEVEVGRDAPRSVERASARLSVTPSLKGGDLDITLGSGMEGMDAGDLQVQQPFEPEALTGFDMDIDLGLDADGAAPPLQGSREATPVPSQANGVEAVPQELSLDITPRMAKRITEVSSAAKGLAPTAAKAGRGKKALFDSVTELDSGISRSAGSQGNTRESRQDRIDKGLLVEPKYLPRSRVEMRLMEIHADPVKYFLPTVEKLDGQEWMIAAPPGLCPELRGLFRFPVKKVDYGKGKRGPEGDENQRPEKRLRSGTPESQVGRRRDPSLAAGLEEPEFGGMEFNPEFDVAGGGDQFRFDIGDVTDGDAQTGAEDGDPEGKKRQREGTVELGPAVGGDLTFSMPELGESLLSIFDEASSQSQDVPGQQSEQKSKWSKNTVKALKILKKELEARPEAEGEAEEKTMSFQQVSNKASKRAASAFFFELLVLGTRDCVKISQDQPYADVNIRSKPRLWEVVGSEGLYERGESVEAET